MGTIVPEMHHPRGVTAKKGAYPPDYPSGASAPIGAGTGVSFGSSGVFRGFQGRC
jgi:hypothetical protein